MPRRTRPPEQPTAQSLGQRRRTTLQCQLQVPRLRRGQAQRPQLQAQEGGQGLARHAGLQRVQQPQLQEALQAQRPQLLPTASLQQPGPAFQQPGCQEQA